VYVDASEITPEGSGKFTTGGEELAPPPHAENNNTLEIITAPLNLARNLFDSILHSRPSRIVFSVATDTGWLVDANSAKTASRSATMVNRNNMNSRECASRY
jgi:hypothetical protein